MCVALPTVASIYKHIPLQVRIDHHLQQGEGDNPGLILEHSVLANLQRPNRRARMFLCIRVIFDFNEKASIF